MRKRTKIISLLAATAVASTTILSGCSLVATITQADMEQVIATVDITKSDELDEELKDYAGAITQTDIKKRDLVAYFITSGYSYISSGYTYGDTFEALAEALVNNEMLIQYALMSTLYARVQDDNETETQFQSASAAVNWFVELVEEDEASAYEALLDYQSKVISSLSGEDAVNYSLYCKYTLYKSINSSIDSYEEEFLDIDDDDESSSATVPTNVDTEVEYYYPTDDSGDLDYGIYTGYSGNLISQSGAYEDDEELEGSTMYSRAYSYHQYVKVLDSNYLILDGEDIKNVYELNYVKEQYITLLREQLVNNFYDIYELELEEEMLDKSSGYTYLNNRYNELKKQQTAAYSDDAESYSSALGNMSSSSFVLYTPDNGGSFGYVYNILAPFSSQQSARLTELSDDLSNDRITESEYYYQRNQLLKAVTTTDQRSDWFNGGIDYSFKATDYADMTFYSSSGDDTHTTLFFKDNLTNNDRYEELENYYGKYTFNGTAIMNADDETYTIIANSLKIDDLLDEFEGYLTFVIGDSAYITGGSVSSTINSSFFNEYDDETNRTHCLYNSSYSAETDGIINYENFIYAMGKVELSGETFSMTNLTNTETGYYAIMSAVNELQYAYTTDTSVLSQYVGYSLAYTGEGTTSYVTEFEYAAQKAVENGVGTYVVVGTDYGWHIIYVTATLSVADNDYEPDWSRVEIEGTFEYNFYQMLKESDLENASTLYQENLVVKFYDDCVTLYEDRYEDLTSLTTTAS